MGRRRSFRALHFFPDDVGELFGGGEFAFQFTGQFRLQGVGGEADGVGFGAEGRAAPQGAKDISRGWSEERAEPPETIPPSGKAPAGATEARASGRPRRFLTPLPGLEDVRGPVRGFRYAPPPANFRRPFGPFLFDMAHAGEATMTPWDFCHKLWQKMGEAAGILQFGYSLWPDSGIF